MYSSEDMAWGGAPLGLKLVWVFFPFWLKGCIIAQFNKCETPPCHTLHQTSHNQPLTIQYSCNTGLSWDLHHLMGIRFFSHFQEAFKKNPSLRIHQILSGLSDFQHVLPGAPVICIFSLQIRKFWFIVQLACQKICASYFTGYVKCTFDLHWCLLCSAFPSAVL